MTGAELIERLRGVVRAYLPPDSGTPPEQAVEQMIGALRNAPADVALDALLCLLDADTLSATLSELYDREVNVQITANWDQGWLLAVGGDPISDKWPVKGLVLNATEIEPWLRERTPANSA